MESKVAENGVPEACSNVNLCKCSCAERLFDRIDALHEDLLESFDVIDDDTLQALSTRLSVVQKVLRIEQEMRKRSHTKRWASCSRTRRCLASSSALAAARLHHR